MNSIISLEDQATITDLLGRKPRGLEAVEVRDEGGSPSVIRVASLVDDKPFPTLFWLVNKRLNYKIDVLEARGLINDIQRRIDSCNDLKQQLVEDHLAYSSLRMKFMSQQHYKRLLVLNLYDELSSRGVGGVNNHFRIKCLHAFYAGHLVVSNVVGRILDEEYL